MSWTYDHAAIATSDLNKVRFLVGDTVQAAAQQQDEEITFALTERGTVYGAAAMCCRALAAKYAREADVSDRDLRTSLSQRSTAYRKMADEYEAQAEAPTDNTPAVLVAGLPAAFFPQ